ncbi:Fur family transcriptional regulator [uncultured Ruminococcus sp.]|uniref:Fur family transcriptional regulator n=1 Tax=uncultured Ruminococcus sp. TaxID=165186 RepID=UPI00262541B3|nr:transcriptional repressor [uncultured Ruminococcus sp.]
MKNRNTLQRRLVLETVQHMHNHPTADEIFREIAKENTLISKATVYRNLKILSEQGEILHIPIPNGADCFDFNTKPHYHMECRKCNRVYDVNMPYQTDLCDKIINRNGFLIESHHIVFSGLCPGCQLQSEETAEKNLSKTVQETA